MKETILLLIILMLIAPTFAQNRSKSADKRFSGLDSELENIMNDWNAAGFAVAGMTANVYVKNGKLCPFVPGQPEYTLQANGNDKFTIEALDGFSVQFTDKNKNVFGSRLFIHPNGTFMATRKE